MSRARRIFAAVSVAVVTLAATAGVAVAGDYSGDDGHGDDSDGHHKHHKKKHHDSDDSDDSDNSSSSSAADDSCDTEGEMRVNGTGFDTCDNGRWVYRACAAGTHAEADGDGRILCRADDA
jgi:hypothetical protein